MKITDKTKLLRALITATTKEVILEFTNCYLNVYCLGNTYFTKVETIQVSTDNKFTGYLTLNKNVDSHNFVLNTLKECCSKKSSEIEFKSDIEGAFWWLYFKRSNKDDFHILEQCNLEPNKPEALTLYLDTINNQEFSNEQLLTYEQYSTKVDTKFEYEVVDINGILISNTDLELVLKVFDVEHNKLVTLKPEFNITNLKKKEIEAIKSNVDNVIVTYEDLVFSNSEELIQITNVDASTYYYCKRCFKL